MNASRARRFLLRLLLPCLVALLVSACAAPGSRSLADETEPVDVDRARQSFQTTCRACHSLADANAAGVFGPDLDLLQPEADTVRKMIDDGGGGMPADLLTGAEADLVARYVAQVAGTRLEREGEGGVRGTTKRTDADG